MSTNEVIPISGILDLVGERAFVRADGYLPDPDDTVVPMNLVRDNGLRRGDTVTGTARAGKLARVDTVNGQQPRYRRPAFADLTPLYPNERLRLETEQHALTTRVTDLVMPVGKGQRALIVAPPKAGKTTVLQAIAHGIAKNHPECHLMLVLVGERPEEVTDLARAVPGEVIAATFDRPPREHIALAELAIERAKRMVEQGRDVVVLLDSLTRLGRAYNLAAPATGRILTGGVDSTALTPPKRFLGAARNIEGGGSLTIFATARHADLRGVQGHQQRRAAPGPPHRRQARVPGHRRPPVRHPQGRAAAHAGRAGRDPLAACRARQPREPPVDRHPARRPAQDPDEHRVPVRPPAPLTVRRAAPRVCVA